jgi:hypothetical protein
MHQVDIYRDGALLVSPKLESQNCTQNKTIMGDNFISFDVELSFYVDFKPGDYCTVFGEAYIINETPGVVKGNKFKYRYTLKMYAERSDLLKVKYLFLGEDNSLREPEFSLMGNAQTFLNLILQNTNRVLSGWSLGEVINTDYKNLTFSEDSCLSALAKIAEAFGTEYWIIGKTIQLTKISYDTGVTFKLGKFKGLYELGRQNTSNSSVITRLYPYGSDKNLPADYGSKKLRLTVTNVFAISNLTCVVTDVGGGNSTFVFSFDPPSDPAVIALSIYHRPAGTNDPWGHSTGSQIGPRNILLPNGSHEFQFVSHPQGVATQIVTIGSTVSTPLLTGFPAPFIENNVSQYGIVEDVEIFQDIYPHRTGTITGVDATDFYKFTDGAIDFDVNAQLLPGLSAKVVFNTGQLSGYQFEIKAFNNGTKQFTILKNKDEAALDLPSTQLKPAIGDKYVLVDIKMPSGYIAAAENELYQKAVDLLAKISVPQYNYNIVLDPVYIRTNSLQPKIGDEITIVDADLQVNRKIRIINTVRNLLSEDSYTLQLSDSITQGTISQIHNNISGAQQGLQGVQNQFQNMAIFNGKIVGDTKLEQGTLIMPDMPSTSTTTGFEPVYRRISDGALHKKV